MSVLEVRGDTLHINKTKNVDLDLKVGECFKIAGKDDIFKVKAFDKDSITSVKWINGKWGMGASKLSVGKDTEAILSIKEHTCPSAGGRRKSRKARKSSGSRKHK
jgi:hypothetical protein